MLLHRVLLFEYDVHIFKNQLIVNTNTALTMYQTTVLRALHILYHLNIMFNTF